MTERTWQPTEAQRGTMTWHTLPCGCVLTIYNSPDSPFSHEATEKFCARHKPTEAPAHD